MKLVIFGTGGVGGYLGARLVDAGHEVHFIARGEHLDVLRSEGLLVESTLGDTSVHVPATDDPADIGPCDFVAFCVKGYDTHEAAGKLEPLLDDETAVVTFQNGVDNERWIADVIGEEYVVGGLVQIFSTITSPGVIAHTGGPARYIYGELDGRRSDRIQAFHEALSESDGIDPVLSDDITIDIWRKFAFICAHSGMTATTRLPMGPIRETGETWGMYRRLMEEVLAVARAKRIDMPSSTVSDLLTMAGEFEADMYSSLHYDLTNENRMELDILHGSVMRHAEAAGVDVPATEAVYAILRPWADRFEP